jgi:hypothetical protein
MDTNEQIFWTFFITSITGFVLALSKMAYKSKCREIDFWCMKIVRDTETEEKELEFDRTHPLTGSESQKQGDV